MLCFGMPSFFNHVRFITSIYLLIKLLSIYRKSPFCRGVVRQTLFYKICLMLIYVGSPSLDRMRGGYLHGGNERGLYFITVFIGMILANFTIIWMDVDLRSSYTSDFLVNFLYVSTFFGRTEIAFFMNI